MTKLYHFSNKLIIIDKLYKNHPSQSVQNLLLQRLKAPRQAIYDAHEIWTYDTETKRFVPYKNRNGCRSLIEEFFAERGISIVCKSSEKFESMRQYRFKDEKNEFLFNLKY